MKLKELIKKLQAKPKQDEEVEFLVYSKRDGAMVCAELTGHTTTELIRVLSKRKKSGDGNDEPPPDESTD